jgi:hypothetical protein
VEVMKELKKCISVSTLSVHLADKVTLSVSRVLVPFAQLCLRIALHGQQHDFINKPLAVEVVLCLCDLFQEVFFQLAAFSNEEYCSNCTGIFVEIPEFLFDPICDSTLVNHLGSEWINVMSIYFSQKCIYSNTDGAILCSFLNQCIRSLEPLLQVSDDSKKPFIFSLVSLIRIITDLLGNEIKFRPFVKMRVWLSTNELQWLDFLIASDVAEYLRQGIGILAVLVINNEFAERVDDTFDLVIQCLQNETLDSEIRREGLLLLRNLVISIGKKEGNKNGMLMAKLEELVRRFGEDVRLKKCIVYDSEVSISYRCNLLLLLESMVACGFDIEALWFIIRDSLNTPDTLLKIEEDQRQQIFPTPTLGFIQRVQTKRTWGRFLHCSHLTCANIIRNAFTLKSPEWLLQFTKDENFISSLVELLLRYGRDCSCCDVTLLELEVLCSLIALFGIYSERYAVDNILEQLQSLALVCLTSGRKALEMNVLSMTHDFLFGFTVLLQEIAQQTPKTTMFFCDSNGTGALSHDFLGYFNCLFEQLKQAIREKEVGPRTELILNQIQVLVSWKGISLELAEHGRVT